LFSSFSVLFSTNFVSHALFSLEKVCDRKKIKSKESIV
jgi:hypothetical protein